MRRICNQNSTLLNVAEQRGILVPGSRHGARCYHGRIFGTRTRLKWDTVIDLLFPFGPFVTNHRMGHRERDIRTPNLSHEDEKVKIK